MEDRSSLALHVPGCGLFLDCVISFPSDHAALSLYKSDCSLIIAQSAINNFLVQIQTYQDWIKSLACHEMCIFHHQCLEFAHFFSICHVLGPYFQCWTWWRWTWLTLPWAASDHIWCNSLLNMRGTSSRSFWRNNQVRDTTFIFTVMSIISFKHYIWLFK